MTNLTNSDRITGTHDENFDLIPRELPCSLLVEFRGLPWTPTETPNSGLRQVLVTADGTLEGMISTSDITNWLQRRQELGVQVE